MIEAPTIRTMTRADIDPIAEIEKSVFSDPWPKNAFREMLPESNRINLVLEMPDGRIGGYVLAQIAGDELQIQNIAVAPGQRRQQLGTRLLRCAEDEGRRRGAICSVLDVRASNEAALGLYHSFGYRMIGRRKNYYRQPVCDALVLFRRLDTVLADGVTREPDNGMVS